MDDGRWYVAFGGFASRHFPGMVKAAAKSLDRPAKKTAKRPRLAVGSSGAKKNRREGTVRQRIEKSLRFAAIALSVEEVIAATWFATAIAAVSASSALMLALLLGGPAAAVYLAPSVAIAPLATYSLVLNYPEIRSNRLRIKSLGAAPEAVTYMAMSLKLSPSLNKAVEFAAENTEGPLAERLRGVLWDVYTRRKESIEESFVGFANDWGEWNDDLKRSLYGLLSASGEGSKEGLGRGLERAQETARTGARRRMEEFVASLKMPTTAFFALCVLLPLIIGTTLPVLSLGGIGVPSVETFTRPHTTGNGIQVIILLDAVFPAVAFLYAVFLLGKRPGTTGVVVPKRTSSRSKRRKWASISMAAGLTPLAVLLLPFGGFAPIIILWSIVLAVSTYLVLSGAERRRMRRETLVLEEQIPDAIFIIGSKLGEGLSFEQALTRASESLKGLEVSSFLDRLRFSIQLQRRGLDETLFGREGILNDCPSRLIKVSLKMVVELSRKDPSAAGKILVDFSHYLRELQEVERDIRAKLGEVVEAMKTTAGFFAPLVLGITSALYMLLAKSFGDLAPLPMSPESFMAALGLYLVVMVPVIASFSVGLETGGEGSELAGTVGRTWPLSLSLFTAAAVVAVAGLGV